VIRGAYLILGLLLISCAGTPPMRHHEIKCRDLTGVDFRYTRASDDTAPISPWHSVELVWLGDATGINGGDLQALRVVESSQRTFGPGEIGPSDPRFDSKRQPLEPIPKRLLRSR